MLPLLGSLPGLLKPRCDAFACNTQYLFHIFKPRLRQIIEVHEPVRQTESPERTNRHLGVPITRGILNREPHLLKGDVPMLVLAENLPISPLQRAEQAPSAAGLVIVTHPIVMAIPHGSIPKQRISPPENAEIVCRRGLVARFNRELLTCPKANGCRR